MTTSTTLLLNPAHLSAATRDVIDKRDKGISGSAFFRQGDPMIPMMADRNFALSAFARAYPTDYLRIEAAMPLDLLFLHQVALANGYDEITFSARTEIDDRLPVYGQGNRIEAIGSLLAQQAPRLSHRRTRHLEEAGQIEAIAPGQVRRGRIDLRLRPQLVLGHCRTRLPEQDLDLDVAEP